MGKPWWKCAWQRWLRLATLIGDFQARVILSLFYFVIVLPFGLGVRLFADPLKRVYLYIVTPAGLKAKSELTYRFLKVTLDFYNQVEAKVQQTLATMEKAGIERVILLRENHRVIDGGEAYPAKIGG